MSAPRVAETTYKGCTFYQLAGDTEYQIDCPEHPDFYPLAHSKADARNLITEHRAMDHVPYMDLPSSDTCPIHGAGCEAWK